MPTRCYACGEELVWDEPIPGHGMWKSHENAGICPRGVQGVGEQWAGHLAPPPPDHTWSLAEVKEWLDA